MPNPRNGCPACKIILDGRVIAASAEYLAESQQERGETAVAGAARYLARVAEASVEATIHGIRAGSLQHEAIDEAHAFSELCCHRAKVIRDAAGGIFDPTIPMHGGTLMAWAEELRLFTTALVGGEYSGAWEVDGVAGIRRKP